jgi:hypothetical protein
MTRLKILFDSFDWWTLQPDTQGTLLTSGAGSGQTRAVASYSADGAFAVAYVPTRRDVSFNLRTLSGPHVAANWYDPASGLSTAAAGSPFARDSTVTLQAPANNSEGSGDWVLVLRTTP